MESEFFFMKNNTNFKQSLISKVNQHCLVLYYSIVSKINWAQTSKNFRPFISNIKITVPKPLPHTLRPILMRHSTATTAHICVLEKRSTEQFHSTSCPGGSLLGQFSQGLQKSDLTQQWLRSIVILKINLKCEFWEKIMN